jgi:heptosyltransferase-2
VRVVFIHPGFLGDTVFLGPATRALRARFPDARIAACVTPRGADVAALLPGCDDVLVFDKRGADAGPLGLLAAARRLRAWKADVALLSHPSLRAATLAALARIPRRIGYGRLLHTEPVRFDRTRLFLERPLDLAVRLGADGGDRRLELRPPGHGEYADRLLGGLSRPIVGLVPGAEWGTKRWSPDRWATLAKGLLARGAGFVVLGSAREKPLAEAIGAGLGAPFVDSTGNTVREALALIARCDLVVGGDTGLVHAARALGVPVTVLFGPTDPTRHLWERRDRVVSLGLSCQPCHSHGPERCPLGHHDCLVKLAVPTVEAAARALLDASEP